MLFGLRQARRLLKPRRQDDPLVKVAGAPTREQAEFCVQTLRKQGIPAQWRRGRAGMEVWVPASQEGQARHLLGLSGRSFTRVPRPRHPARD